MPLDPDISELRNSYILEPFVNERGALRTQSSFSRFSLASVFSVVLAAAGFWLAFIAVWSLFGGTAL